MNKRPTNAPRSKSRGNSIDMKNKRPHVVKRAHSKQTTIMAASKDFATEPSVSDPHNHQLMMSGMVGNIEKLL